MAASMELSKSEQRVLDVLWSESPLTVGQVIERLKKGSDWHENTIKTLLTRLVQKKAVARRKDGGRFFYRPLVSRDAILTKESEGLLKRFFDGRMAPPPVEVLHDLVPAQTAPDEKPLTEVETVINAVGGPQARPLVDFWLPPLQLGLDADEMVRRLRGKPWTQDYGDTPGLRLPLGQEDCPYECTQPVVALDLRDRHWAIAGGVQSGLTTALTTAVLGGALMYRPDYVQFYCIAGAASAMMNLRSVPHVAGIAAGTDIDGVLRVLDSIIELIDFRTKKFGELDITAEEFFERRAADIAANIARLASGRPLFNVVREPR